MSLLRIESTAEHNLFYFIASDDQTRVAFDSFGLGSSLLNPGVLLIVQ